jgi:hypothetical protein
MKHIIILLLLFSTFITSLSAQIKSEREYRIKRSEVPEEAREWLNDTFEAFKWIKWYKQIENEEESFEAKFRYKRSKFSVNFSTQGRVIDVEFIIQNNDIPEKTRNTISQYLESNFNKHRILKIQQQLLGLPDDLEDYFDEDEREGITKNYEIEFHGVTETQNELWEGLFDEDGNLILLQQIEQEPTFNLEF